MNEASQLQLNVGVTDNSSMRNRSPQSSWFEVLAESWGRALDQQANRIADQSAALGEGLDDPSQITRLTAESLRMQFLSNSSHTAITSVGTGLETMARKQ